MRVLLSALMLALSLLTAARAEAPPAKFEIPNSEVHTIQSEILGRTYHLYIKKPSGYERPENSDQRYPVIYLNDGPYTFQVASGVTRLPMNAGEFEKAILVGVSFAKGEKPQASRTRDLTPSVDEDWALATGGAAEYFQFLKSEAIPFVENNFRADPKRRVLSGQSFGGLFGAWVLLTEPEAFHAYILTSPSLWFDEKIIFDMEQAYASKHDDLNATVFLATGEHETPISETRMDLVGDQAVFAARLRSRNYPGLMLRDEIVPNGLHETTFPVGFIRAMQWLFHVHDE